MMKVVGLSAIFVALVSTILCQTQCSAFSPLQQHHGVALKNVILPSPTPSSALFRKFNEENVGSFRLRMTAEESKDHSENNDTKSVDSVSEDDDDDAAEDKPSITKTVLLTVPLFCKFVVVLLIKLLTDVVVFPLLFLYRLVGQMKRKFLKMFSKGKLNDGEPANGASE